MLPYIVCKILRNSRAAGNLEQPWLEGFAHLGNVLSLLGTCPDRPLFPRYLPREKLDCAAGKHTCML